MVMLAVDWTTLSSLATGAGTLVLAVATFASVRSSNRAARIAEAALQEQRRPVLAPSRLEDPRQKIMFLEGNWLAADGGHAALEHQDGKVFLAVSLRNVGAGIAVCQGWTVRPGYTTSGQPAHSPVEEFRSQTRDLYVPAGDIGMWQGGLRDPDDERRAAVARAIEDHQPLTLELLYSDLTGQQRTISRFGLVPTDGGWMPNLSRHWYLDWDGPRSEQRTLEAAQVVVTEREAADRRRAADQAQDSHEGSTDSAGT